MGERDRLITRLIAALRTVGDELEMTKLAVIDANGRVQPADSLGPLLAAIARASADLLETETL